MTLLEFIGLMFLGGIAYVALYIIAYYFNRRKKK